MKQPASLSTKVLIVAVALGLATGAILLAVVSRPAPSPGPQPPDAYADLGPVAGAEAPFYGTFRLVLRQDSLTVDALTGQVEPQ